MDDLQTNILARLEELYKRQEIEQTAQTSPQKDNFNYDKPVLAKFVSFNQEIEAKEHKNTASSFKVRRAREYNENEQQIANNTLGDGKSFFDDSTENTYARNKSILLENNYDNRGTTVTAPKPKRPFLKRGEGLKQRFKIDPEVLRINNLPRYKFTKGNVQLVNSNPEKNTIKPKTNSVCPTKPKLVPPQLDFQEKRFQQLLISSENALNSTPDIKHISSEAEKTKVHYTEWVKQNYIHDNTPVASSENITISTQQKLPLTWAKVLNTNHIKAIPVQEMRTKTVETTENSSVVEYDEDLSIFELLEQKAREGAIDMNSNCIKKFMERKKNYKSDDSDDIPVDKRLMETNLCPVLEDEKNENVDNTEHSFRGSIYLSKSKNESCSPNSEEIDDDSISNCTTTSQHEDSIQLSKNEIFMQIKEALFSALQSRAEKAEKAEFDDGVNKFVEDVPDTPKSNKNTPLQSPTRSFTNEMQEKANLIKARLEELDKEIAIFKENNHQLIKAKQEHEVEKAQFEHERIAALDFIKDEKIKIELYLHDERMKIDEEKRAFEQKMRLQKSNSKERREITRLKGELEELQNQIKLKEQNHIAAQSRLRTQIRNSERDLKQLQEDIDRLNAENKRLLNENAKIMREKNNRMLNEINRNIAKLAPKPATHDETPLNVRKSATSSTLPTVKKVSNCKATPSPRQFKEVIEIKANRKGCASESGEEDELSDVLSEKQCKVGENSATPSTDKITQCQCSTKSNRLKESSSDGDFKRELINSDGSKDIWYPNGNLKKISADNMKIRMLYFNKDIKETDINEGTVKYYYAETNTWHTTYLDGLEILEFPNGHVEHRHKNGVIEVHFPNNSIKITNPADENLVEEWRYPDGSNLKQMQNGDRILILPNGQKEIHTKMYKRREYPDGTVKTVYPDGSQETRYSNGRVRFKDKDGTLIMDMQNV